MKYRKKSVVIEAIQLSKDTFQEIWDWMGPYISVSGSLTECFLLINTMEGTLKAVSGDYIIKGIKGEFYPCKPEIFELTYELAIDPPPRRLVVWL